MDDQRAPDPFRPGEIPEGRPYLDFMSEMRSLSSRYEEPLADVSNTKRLWSAAFRISAISHHPIVIDRSEAVATLMRLERGVRIKLIAGGKARPLERLRCLLPRKRFRETYARLCPRAARERRTPLLDRPVPRRPRT